MSLAPRTLRLRFESDLGSFRVLSITGRRALSGLLQDLAETLKLRVVFAIEWEMAKDTWILIENENDLDELHKFNDEEKPVFVNINIKVRYYGHNCTPTHSTFKYLLTPTPYYYPISQHTMRVFDFSEDDDAEPHAHKSAATATGGEIDV